MARHRDDDEGDLPVLDLDTYQRRMARRAEAERRRRQRRTGWAGGAAAALVLTGGLTWWLAGRDTATTSAAADAPVRSPVSVESMEPLPPLPERTREPAAAASPPGDAAAERAGTPVDGADPPPAGGNAPAAAPAAAETARGRPVVWVQAGHVPPGEPGYRAQTGASGGPFGSEQAFSTRLRDRLIRRLRSAGVDARPNAALVTPLGSRGAVFISLHFDAPGGAAVIGHAVSEPGRRENWYRGEGFGTASPTPYPDSAPHRDSTAVTPAVERTSAALAERIAARYRRVFTSANGAGTRFRGVEPRTGNVRMMHFYGYYRTNAAARVLVECGAAGADDAFLARTDLIATTLTRGITDHLRDRDLLR